MADTYRIKDLINRDAILIDKRTFASRDDLFEEVGKAAAAAHSRSDGAISASLSPDALKTALQQRAKNYPVGTGGGILLPHGHVPALSRFVGAFVKLTAPQTIRVTPDNVPADLVFALFGPEDERRTDLRLLAYIAMIFANPDLREELRDAECIDQIHRALTSSAFPSSSVAKSGFCCR